MSTITTTPVGLTPAERLAVLRVRLAEVQERQRENAARLEVLDEKLAQARATLTQRWMRIILEEMEWDGLYLSDFQPEEREELARLCATAPKEALRYYRLHLVIAYA